MEVEGTEEPTAAKIPVTILTGFLGAGKVDLTFVCSSQLLIG